MNRLWLILLLLSSRTLLQAQEKSAILLKESSFDFGEIPEEGGQVYHVFSFENPGSDTLWLESVKGHCHCTSGQLISPFVPPGKSGKIRVTYDPKGRPWAFDAGLDLKARGKEKITLKLGGTATRGKKWPRFSPAEFTQKFDFNEKTIETGEKEFRKFIVSLLPLLERNGDVKVRIESSASTVPTKSFSSNEELTRARAASARSEILKIVREAGAMEERLQFQPDDCKVQGPEYSSDYQKHPERFAAFQYVRVRVF
jgi:hypothetical protein